MITHYYLYASTGLVNITSTNDVNKCFRLGAEESSLNVNNYAYYAASKSSGTSFLSVGKYHSVGLGRLT